MAHPLDLELAGLSGALAAEARLRGAGAVHAATARACGTTLVTLDREFRDRVASLVPAATPAEWMEAGP